ncbi:MAG: M42 family metallopeptidase [Mycoplasma sp.]|nr:M42 family metallopeptidase [Mycoplasma sp.]
MAVNKKETNKQIFKFMEPFLDSDGISGFEHEIADVYIKHAKKAKAKLERDGFGSVIAKMGTKGPKVMFAAHMDEVGFVVRSIEKEGQLRVSPVGGHWTHTILAMPVKVITSKGKVFKGVFGSTAPHVLTQSQRTKVMEMRDVYVDVGVKDKEEAEKLGIAPGDQIIRESKSFQMANDEFFCAKAIDNRMSVAILAKIMEKLAGKTLKCQAYFVATAQEEVGLRGGKASTQQIQPDVAIAIDTTTSHDTPGIIPGDNKIGLGMSITMKDNSAIANPALANHIFDLAKSKKIPVYKYVSQGGGNDSGVTQYSQGGIPVVTISIPTRYLHTPHEVASIKDFNAVVDGIVEFVSKFDDKTYKTFLYK